ncbi:unnamed protein product, partial [Prorocentrum cordatum]
QRTGVRECLGRGAAISGSPEASPACPESAAVDPVGAAAELAATGAAGASEGAAEQGAQEGDATGVACQAEKAEGAVAEQAVLRGGSGRQPRRSPPPRAGSARGRRG